MKKYELLKQYQMEAAKLQLEKEKAMEIVKELCDEWNIALSNKQEQTIMNNIIINKGKIVEIQTTKEVVIDNTDNDRIQELEEELAGKELLLNEFRENMDEKIKMTNTLKENIEDLKDELEVKQGIIDHQTLIIKTLKEELQQLKESSVQPKTTIEIVDDPIYNDIEEEGDVMPQFNIPEEYKDNQEIKEVVKIQTDKWLNARAVGPFTKEEMQDKCIAAANMTIETIIAEQKKAEEYNIRYTKLHNKKDQTVVAVKGEITLEGKPYVFKYGATHEYPCIYGCMDMELIKEAKDALDKAIHMIKDDTEKKHAYDVVYAFDKGIVAWQTDDGAFKGYTKEYAFVWDGTSAVPCGATVKNALDETKPYRKMNASWGKGFIKRSEEIIEFCRTIDKRTKTTKEEIKEETKELHVSQEIDDLDI